MTPEQAPQRILFTFQSNGEIDGRRMVEASAEHLAIHEAPVGPDARKLSWFGDEIELAAACLTLGFKQLDVDGVLATLRVNKVSTREVEVVVAELETVGFSSAA